MKKINLVLTLLLAMIFLLSCGNGSNNQSGIEEDNLIKTYNEAVNYNYSYFDVVVVTTKGDLELTSTYNVEKKNELFEITYSIESYNEIDLSSGNVPEEMISTKTGKTTPSTNQFDLNSFKFAADKFKTYSFKDNSLTVTMDNAKELLKTDYDCNNFEMNISYSNVLTNISLNYYLSNQTYCQITYKNFR